MSVAISRFRCRSGVSPKASPEASTSTIELSKNVRVFPGLVSLHGPPNGAGAHRTAGVEDFASILAGAQESRGRRRHPQERQAQPDEALLPFARQAAQWGPPV